MILNCLYPAPILNNLPLSLLNTDPLSCEVWLVDPILETPHLNSWIIIMKKKSDIQTPNSGMRIIIHRTPLLMPLVNPVGRAEHIKGTPFTSLRMIWDITPTPCNDPWIDDLMIARNVVNNGDAVTSWTLTHVQTNFRTCGIVPKRSDKIKKVVFDFSRHLGNDTVFYSIPL